ncbi:MAG: hypothetical protein ABIA37_04100 [Candidatus Woesearchaeota archaeon]
MNNRAQFDVARKTIYWMMAGVVITIVVIAFAFVMANYKNKITTIPAEVRAELLVLRFVNNGDCFAYENGRTFPGVIDLTRFTNETLYHCYHTEQEEGYKDYNFGLTLVNENITLRTNNYFNKVDFVITKPVLVRKGTDLTNDVLRIYVQVKI